MDELTYKNYNDIRKNMWDNEVLNHYINNFSQHFYYTDSIKLKENLSVFLLKIKNNLENIKTKNKLYNYLLINYRNNNVNNSIKVISEFYEN